jgi:hypothetical protein
LPCVSVPMESASAVLHTHVFSNVFGKFAAIDTLVPTVFNALIDTRGDAFLTVRLGMIS